MPRQAFVPESLRTGPFSLQQALASGLTKKQLRGKAWRRLGPRTYVLATLDDGPLLWIRAAATRLPPDAVWGGMVAAWLHGLDVRLDPSIEARLPHNGGVSGRAAMTIGRASLGEAEVVIRHGFRVTSIERTLADLSAQLPLTEAVVIADMALNRGLTDIGKLISKGDERAGQRGVERFRRVIEQADAGAESPMETRLRLILVGAGLPRPDTQVELHDARGVFLARTDLYYPSARLAVEYDGDGHRLSLTDDNRRQNRLVEAGHKILRFTAPDVYGSPDAVVERVRAALAAGPPPPTLDPRPAASPFRAPRSGPRPAAGPISSSSSRPP